MTDPQPQAALKAAPVSQIKKDDLYGMAYALLVASRRVVTAVQSSSSEVYRQIDLLALRTEELGALMFPPPPPEKPDDCETLYARGVRAHDRVWVKSHGWVKVVQADVGRLGVRWLLEVPGVKPEFWREFELEDLFAVRRPGASEADE